MMQIKDENDLRDLFCGPNVEYPTAADKQAVDTVFCNTDFNRIMQELLDKWNWEYISSVVCYISFPMLYSINKTLSWITWTEAILVLNSLDLDWYTCMYYLF